MARVLVTYGTQFGSTAEIADRIAERFTVSGFDTDVLQANPGIDVRKYDAVVVGSPMYGSKWLADPALLLYMNADLFNSVPLAVFTVGMLSVKHSGELEKLHDEFFEKTFTGDHALPDGLARGVFDGSMDRTNLPMCLRIFDRLVSISPTGDFRDWEKIETWADSVADDFRIKLDEEPIVHE